MYWCRAWEGVLAWSVGRKEQRFSFELPSPYMQTFEIPTGPSITKMGGLHLLLEAKVCPHKRPVTRPLYGSITYDQQKGVMPLEWANEQEFLAWLTAEETENTIKFILSNTEASDSSANWQARCIYRCSQEFSGGKSHYNYKNTTKQDQKIPSIKAGCQRCLTIKYYPNTETILGKYEGEHNHTLGNDNL